MQSPRPATESPAVSGERRLFRPTFSLRTLLLGMAVIGGGFGMFQRLDRQRQLIARIEAAGAVCRFTERESIGRFETWLRKWLPESYFDDVKFVFVDDSINNVDGVLAHVAELKSLVWIELNHTQVSDAGLKHLAGLRSLKGVFLSNTQVSDAGLAHLAGLKSLQWLNLNGTQVSDAGLSHLAGLKSLWSLELTKTQVSDAGIKQLKSSLPDCRINGP